MGTTAAPRIDEQLRAYIAGAPARVSAAEVTRGVGDLAWRLGLTRPSYESVRVLLGRERAPVRSRSAGQTSGGQVVLHVAARVVGSLWDYPGPGLAGWYRRYSRGAWP